MPVNRPTWAALFALAAFAAGIMCTTAPALAAPPETPVTKPATAVTGTTATLNGELNPGAGSEKVNYLFFYGPGSEPCGGQAFRAPESFVETEGNHIPVSPALTSLVGNTEYTFCLVAFNNELTESATGASLTFKTLPEKPVVVSETSSGVTPFAATLHTEVNPENQPTTACVFEYGKTAEYGNSAPCEPGTLEGSTAQTTSLPLAGLESATEYHYRVVVKNATGETKGTDAQFTTLAAESPIVDGESVSGLTARAAKLEAQVNPNYQETTYGFEYATNEALTGAIVVAGASPLAAGFGDQPATVELSGLVTRTTYFYRVAAQNHAGTKAGPIQSFTTLATPAVTTGEASTLTRTSAVLTGTVNPAGAATSYHFAYVDQAGYEAALAEPAANPYSTGHTTPESATIGPSYTPHPADPTFIGELQPGHTYHYALVATNSVGTTVGPDVTFTTSPPAPPIVVSGEPVNPTPIPVQMAVISAQLVAWPAFVGRELAGVLSSKTVTTGGPRPSSKAQKLAKALKACGKKPKKQRASCRRQAKRRYR